MAETLGVYDAKARFSELIDRAERGEETVVTRHGRVVARIAPPNDTPPVRTAEEAAELRAQARELRDRIAARGGPLTLDEIMAWRDEGRR